MRLMDFAAFSFSITGQVSVSIRQITFLHWPVFLVNSRQAQFIETFRFTPNSHPFVRNHGVILPSSLTNILSIPLVHLTPANLCWFTVRFKTPYMHICTYISLDCEQYQSFSRHLNKGMGSILDELSMEDSETYRHSPPFPSSTHPFEYNFRDRLTSLWSILQWKPFAFGLLDFYQHSYYLSSHSHFPRPHGNHRNDVFGNARLPMDGECRPTELFGCLFYSRVFAGQSFYRFASCCVSCYAFIIG